MITAKRLFLALGRSEEKFYEHFLNPVLGFNENPSSKFFISQAFYQSTLYIRFVFGLNKLLRIINFVKYIFMTHFRPLFTISKFIRF